MLTLQQSVYSTNAITNAITQLKQIRFEYVETNKYPVFKYI